MLYNAKKVKFDGRTDGHSDLKSANGTATALYRPPMGRVTSYFFLPSLTVEICHDEQSRRQTYPFHVKDQYWTQSYVTVFCQRPRCLVCHPEVLMQNLNYFRNYCLFSVKNVILDFNKKKGTGKRLFLNFTPLYLSEKQ